MTAQSGWRTFNMTGNNGFLAVDITAGDTPYMNLVNGEYQVSGVAVINSSKQFVGAGVNCPSYGVACAAVNVNDGVQRYGRTVTLYDRDGNAMTFRGGVLCTT